MGFRYCVQNEHGIIQLCMLCKASSEFVSIFACACKFHVFENICKKLLLSHIDSSCLQSDGELSHLCVPADLPFLGTIV